MANPGGYVIAPEWLVDVVTRKIIEPTKPLDIKIKGSYNYLHSVKSSNKELKITYTSYASNVYSTCLALEYDADIGSFSLLFSYVDIFVSVRVFADDSVVVEIAE